MTKVLTTVEKANLMKKLPYEERVKLVNDSPNVVGLDRFMARAKQVTMSRQYKQPIKPPPSGAA